MDNMSIITVKDLKRRQLGWLETLDTSEATHLTYRVIR